MADDPDAVYCGECGNEVRLGGYVSPYEGMSLCAECYKQLRDEIRAEMAELENIFGEGY